MRFVHDEQADPVAPPATGLAETLVGKPLGRDENESIRPQSRVSTCSQSSRLAELTVAARMPIRSAAAIWLRISANSGRDDHRRPARRSRSIRV